MAQPGIHSLTVRLILENITIAEVTKDFEVKGYVDTSEEMQSERNYFKITETYVLTNEGNTETTVMKNLHLPIYKKIFTSLEPDTEKATVEGKRVYQWKQTLMPGDNYTVTITKNYNILVLLLLAGIAGTILYYVFRSPVILIKEAQKHGDIIKVKILVRNRSDKQIADVNIIDKVPNMAEVHKKTDLGTLKPKKIIKSASKGTNLRWEVEFLEPYEERLIMYKMHSKLKLIGGVSLPPAKIKFKANEKERSTFSNSVNVMEE